MEEVKDAIIRQLAKYDETVEMFRKISWRLIMVLAAIIGVFFYITIMFIWMGTQPNKIDEGVMKVLEDERAAAVQEKTQAARERREMARERREMSARDRERGRRMDSMTYRLQRVEYQNNVLMRYLMQRDSIEKLK